MGRTFTALLSGFHPPHEGPWIWRLPRDLCLREVKARVLNLETLQQKPLALLLLGLRPQLVALERGGPRLPLLRLRVETGACSPPLDQHRPINS